MPLTDSAIRNLKPETKTRKLSDGGGLYLQLEPSGSRLWRCAYRWQGKQRTASFGKYPKVGLKLARQLRDELKAKLAEGIDPAAPERAAQHPFRAVAKEWFDANQAKWVSGYAGRIWSRLDEDIFPAIGDMGVASIEPTDVLAALRTIEARGALELAKRVRQSVSQIFRFAVASGYCKADPSSTLADAMQARPRVQHRAALRQNDLPDFFLALRDYTGDPITALGMRLIVHTFVRSSELRLAEWSEIQGDTWRIPAERMKMRKEHIVPLSKQVRATLKQLKKLTGESKYLLPGNQGPGKPISDNTLIFALYRLGYHSRATVHGFRSTASTILNESGKWRADAIERQLAHVPENEVRAAYNAALYLDERREMVQWYSDLLGDLEDEGLGNKLLV